MYNRTSVVILDWDLHLGDCVVPCTCVNGCVACRCSRAIKTHEDSIVSDFYVPLDTHGKYANASADPQRIENRTRPDGFVVSAPVALLGSFARVVAH